MRSLWTGAIGFGLVNIPVKIYSATQESRLDLDMLDRHDHEHIRFKRINEKTGKEVQWKDIVKGFEFKGKMVVLEEKDFEKASAAKTKLIEIQEFVQESEINSMYFETPYYLQPQKSGEKPYNLLLQALEKAKMAGLCTFVLRTKESLGIIKPVGKILILNQIRYAEEIRKTKDLDIPEAKIKKAELDMAIQLVKQLAGEFDISKYKDNYKEVLLKIIKAKAKGKAVKAPKMRVVHSAKTDLMDQLKESLKARKKAS